MTIEIMQNRLVEYLNFLQAQEKAPSTVAKYRRDINKFLTFLTQEEPHDETQERLVERMDLLRYKAFLQTRFKPASIDSYLVALNKYLAWLGAEDLKVAALRRQQRNSLELVLSKSDYERLLRYAKKLGKERMFYLMRTLACSGIRIEELKYVTAEAVIRGQGFIQIENKGKIRDIVLPPALCRDLRQYCRKNGLTQGVVFHGRDPGRLLDKSYIWKEMKLIAGKARVNKRKVYAHSFRHLFARTFLDASGGNIAELADLLGHSSLETTRIYTRSSNREKRDKLAKLGL